jgi:hypothetical protein
MSLTVAKPATTLIPVQLSETEFTRLSYRTSRCPSVGRSAHWTITVSLTSSCGSCRRACHGSAYPYRKTSRASRPFTTRPSPKSLPRGPMMGHCGGRLWLVCGISRPRSTSIFACSIVTGSTPWPKRGDAIGYSGYKHQKRETVIAIIDNHGSVLAPVPVAPVDETDMVLLQECSVREPSIPDYS